MSDKLLMSDKLQFVVTTRKNSPMEASDKLKLIGLRRTLRERYSTKREDS
jgi:hypothetical protein